MYIRAMVSGQAATDKTPKYEMPLTFVFRVWESIFCIGVLDVGVLSRDHELYNNNTWLCNYN